MWRCPEDIEEGLWQAARAVLGDGPLQHRRLREAVIERSRLYTSERQDIHAPSDERADLAARALFFTVADVPKSMIPLAELGSRGLVPQRPRVLDLGAGCGAMTLGLMAYGIEPAEVVAIDRDGMALRIAARVAKQRGVELETVNADLGSLGQYSGFDLVVAGTVVNELDDPLVLVREALRVTAQSGAVIIIEPALRDTARALHRLRDQCISAGLATVFAPCVRSQVPCPMLANERDWCHEDRSTELPPRARQLASETGLRRHGLKFSYLVLRKDGASLVDAPVSAARVVSRVRKLKGRWQGFLCSDAGRRRTTLLKRQVTADNHAFLELERGDLIRGVAGERVGEGDRLERSTPALPPG
ncbi:MAG: class I SAM-dependent methyltransferase [Deltaproteobacteria bacterium]|nr:class I SAM-dependent methyltransferase [Deltaproteobacteria bacterium]